VFCSSSIYGFWLPLWYLQTLLVKLTNQTMEEIQSISQFLRKHNNDRNNI
jgi:hypothetical protein